MWSLRSLALFAVSLLVATGCELNTPRYLDYVVPGTGADAGAPVTPAVVPVVKTPDERTDAGTPPNEVTPIDPIAEPNDLPFVYRLVAQGIYEVGRPLRFSTRIGDEDGIDNCKLGINGRVFLLMDLTDDAGTVTTLPLSGWAKLEYTPDAVGDVTFQVTCEDDTGLQSKGDAITLFIGASSVRPPDTVKPNVTIVYPMGTYDIRDGITVFARYSDAGDIASCDIVVNGVVVPVAITLNAPIDTKYPAPSVGLYAVAVQCTDAAGNVGISATNTVTVYSVSGLGAVTASATSVLVGTPLTFSSTIEARTTMASCSLLWDGVNAGAAAIASGKVTATVALGLVGSHVAQFTCVDSTAKTHLSGTKAVTITPDVTPPLVGAVSWSPNVQYPVTGTAYAFSATASDAIALAGCELTFTNGTTVTAPVAATVTAGIATATATYNGYATATVTCRDTTGNAKSSSVTIPVAPPPPPPPPPPVDVTPPIVGAISWIPADALLVVGSPYVFSASASDETALQATCTLTFVDSLTAPVIGGSASAVVAAYDGSDTVTMTCLDVAGNTASSTATLAVAPPPVTP